MIVIRYLAEQIRETLPQDEAGAGMFVAGMAWGLGLFWAALIAVTWLWAVSR